MVPDEFGSQLQTAPPPTPIPWQSPAVPSGSRCTSRDLAGSITETEPSSVFTNKWVPSFAIQSGAPVTGIFDAPSCASVTASGGGSVVATDSVATSAPPGSPVHAERIAMTVIAVRASSRGLTAVLAPRATGSSIPHIPVGPAQPICFIWTPCSTAYATFRTRFDRQ